MLTLWFRLNSIDQAYKFSKGWFHIPILDPQIGKPKCLYSMRVIRPDLVHYNYILCEHYNNQTNRALFCFAVLRPYSQQRINSQTKITPTPRTHHNKFRESISICERLFIGLFGK